MEKSESQDRLSISPDTSTILAANPSIPLRSTTIPALSVKTAGHSEGQLAVEDEISIHTTSRTITQVEPKKHPTPSQGGIIALGIVCGLLIFGILLFMLLYCHHRRQKLETQNTEATIPRPRNLRRPRFPAERTPRENHTQNGPQDSGFYRPIPQGLPGLPSEASMGLNHHRQSSLREGQYNAMDTPLNRMRGMEYPPGYMVSNQQPAPMARMRGVGYPPQMYMPGPEYRQPTQPADPQEYGYGNYLQHRSSGQIHRSVRDGSSMGEPQKGEMGWGPELVRKVPSLGSRRESGAGDMRGPMLAI